MSHYYDYYEAFLNDYSSDEDNYAGAFDDYDDDFYEDIIEEAGYDAWDIQNKNPEFEFDDERPLFDFHPLSEYDLQYDSDKIMTYQALSQLTENTSKLLEAWVKRSELVSDLPESQDSSVRLLIDDFLAVAKVDLNYYQLELEDRVELRAFSVKLLERLFGGRAEVFKLKQTVDQIGVFVKRVMMTILGSSLPCPVPYPVMNMILAYVLPGDGASNLGQVSINETDIEEEIEAMLELYQSMAEVFDPVKVIMFNSEPTLPASSIVETKRRLEESFSVLVAKVSDSELEVCLEGL